MLKGIIIGKGRKMVKQRLSVFLSLFLVVIMLTGCNTEEKDEFIWLEDIDGQASMEWVKEHNDKTVSELEKYPYFQKFFEKSLEIYNSKERIAYPSVRNNMVYNFWQDDNHERGILRRTTLRAYLNGNPSWETVLDIDALAKEEGTKWAYHGATWLYPEYQRCLISLSPGGGDAAEIREFDVSKKQFVKDGFYLPAAKGSADWIDINTLIVATDFGEGTMTSSGYPATVKIIKRGQKPSEGKTIFRGDVNDMGVWGYVINTPEKDYIIVQNSKSFYEKEYYYYLNGELKLLELPKDADLHGFFKDLMLIELKSDWKVNGKEYEQGAVLSINFDKFLNGERNFSEIWIPDAKSSLTSLAITKDYLLLNILNNIKSELYGYFYNKGIWSKRKIGAPEMGTINVVNASNQHNAFFFTYNGFLNPTALYYAGERGTVRKLKSLPEFFDAGTLKVEQRFVVSKDGTKVPYFIVFPKGMELNGKNPTLLYGYGGFEISMRPRYSAIIGSHWLSEGGVYVLANIRGGGEFGPAWHQAALKENRQNAYDDFIAIAEDLIARKVTSPEHLGIMGGSNGGLLMGVMFTQRPDLFKAVVCSVPLLDMKRYNKLLAGASWMAEYGNPDIPEEWEYIKKYSPYQNVLPGKNYPKVFFSTTTRDDRVHPAHARKMAAKMEKLGYQIYYYENTEGGHSAGTTNKQRAFLSALTSSYLSIMLK